MSESDLEKRYNELQQRYDFVVKQIQRLGESHLFSSFKFRPEILADLNLSFSSSGEDLWLRQFMKPLLKRGQAGFYIDLGANHPIQTSNTYLFYAAGWRGICVDANLQFQAEFLAQRPRDIFVHAAVSDQEESLYFSRRGDVPGHKLGRVSRDANDFPKGFLPPIKVPSHTLADILRRHMPADTAIDFMSVDLEKSELAALRSNDWQVFRPRVILMEAEGIDFDKPHAFPTIAYLISQGYRYRGYAVNNVLMVDANSGL